MSALVRRLGEVTRTQEVAGVAEALLAPTALLAGVLALWRLGVDLGWFGEFFIARGVWSHWQVWLATAAALRLVYHRQRRS